MATNEDNRNSEDIAVRLSILEQRVRDLAYLNMMQVDTIQHLERRLTGEKPKKRLYLWDSLR